MNDRLKEMIVNICGDNAEITRDTDFTCDLGLKSIDLLDLITDVEDEFGIEISDEAVEEIHTVGDLMDYIEENS